MLDGRVFTWGKCLRAAFYRCIETDRGCGPQPKLAMMGRFGKTAEIDAITRWKEMGLYVDNNVKFYNKELIVSGELDAVIHAPDDPEYLIGYEIKTFYAWPAQKKVLGGKRPPVPGAPKTNQYLQSVLYAWQYKDIIDEYRMYYVERGSGERAEFVVGCEDNGDCWWEQVPGADWNLFKEGKVYAPFTMDDIIGRYKDLIQYVQNKKLPPRDYEGVWNDETIEYMYRNGELGKSYYDKWVKSPAKNPQGAWSCRLCDYRAQCDQDEMMLSLQED
jgi:hypothetical protein